MIHGRRFDLGRGSVDLVKLADARRVAADNRAIARTGGDPRRARVSCSGGPTAWRADALRLRGGAHLSPDPSGGARSSG